MRAKILVGCAAVILGVIGMSGQAQRPAAPTTVTSAEAEKTFFTQYCYGCHNQAAKTRGVESALRITLDSLDPAHIEKDPEQWEKVVRKLRAGMMPPSGMPRPKPEFLESAIVFAENELDRTAKLHIPPPGLHRMNRTEYANAVRDLLDIEVDAGKFLPSDDSTRGFDNIAGALGISPDAARRLRLGRRQNQPPGDRRRQHPRPDHLSGGRRHRSGLSRRRNALRHPRRHDRASTSSRPTATTA